MLVDLLPVVWLRSKTQQHKHTPEPAELRPVLIITSPVQDQDHTHTHTLSRLTQSLMTSLWSPVAAACHPPWHTALRDLCWSCCWAPPPPAGCTAPWWPRPLPRSSGCTRQTRPGSRWWLWLWPPARYLERSRPGRSYRAPAGTSEEDTCDRRETIRPPIADFQTKLIVQDQYSRLEAAVDVVRHEQQHAELLQSDELHVALIALTHLQPLQQGVWVHVRHDG